LYKPKKAQKPIFRGNNSQKALRADFFRGIQLKTNFYVFSSNSAAIWALVQGPSPENGRISRFQPFLKKPIFDDFGGLVRPQTMEIWRF